MGKYAKITSILVKTRSTRNKDHLKKIKQLRKENCNSLVNGCELTIETKLQLNRNKTGKAQKNNCLFLKTSVFKIHNTHKLSTRRTDILVVFLKLTAPIIIDIK